jgi:hypothetical protein
VASVIASESTANDTSFSANVPTLAEVQFPY